MSKRPRIAITSDYNDRRTHYAVPYGYADSVENAGGLPLLIPYGGNLSLIKDFLDQVDGVLMSGGDDIDPACYNETYHPKTQPIDPKRQQFELALLAEIETRQLPLLGICLGCQMMNIYRGGSLYQFLPDLDRPDPIEHRRLEDWNRRHPIQINTQSLLYRIMGIEKTESNTSHKQAIRIAGKGLSIVAKAPDGVTEAIEDPSRRFFLGVQWHPERMPESQYHRSLFEALIKASS